MVWGRATKVSFDHMETLKEKRKISGDMLLTHSLALRPSVFQETESQNPALGISTRWGGVRGIFAQCVCISNHHGVRLNYLNNFICQLYLKNLGWGWVKREKNSTYFDNGLRDTSFPERLDLGLLLIIPNEF